MRPLLRSSVFVLALGATGVVASAHSADAQQTRYPESSTSYRKRLDGVIKTLRTACSARCPATDRERIMSGIDRLASRVMDVCADGVVTEAENDYVMKAMPPAPPPRPPDPRPND